ncbi:MAG: 30S ribosomal protein S2, partial [Candidatus Omnitrophota bacterium]
HFGHQKRKWNPKMKPFIFGEKNNTYIIDLQQTVESVIEACRFLNKVAHEGGYVLFVGTKKQAQDIIKAEALRCGMFYVDQRWLGGMMTNFQTIRKSINRLESLETMREDGTFAKLSKKEVSKLTKEINKLKKNLDGVRKMDRLPKALFIIDAKKEEIAVHEANVLSIPVVALVDTNSDPDVISYVIPGNDDAIKSIKLITGLAADATAEGRNQFLQLLETEESSIDERLSKEPRMELVGGDDKIEKFIDKREERMEEEAREKKPAMKAKPTKPLKKKKGK